MHRRRLFCQNQRIYLDEYIQVIKNYNALQPSYSKSLFLDVVKQNLLFFYLVFLSRIFTNHRTAGEGGDYLFMTCLICLVCVMICIFNSEELIYGTFKDCIDLCNSHYCFSYFRSLIGNTRVTMAILMIILKCLGTFS